ncbi:MAG: hypothetical protein JXA33_18670 [Anaerolineae bacterium]|nr:hypothetical protein [Anaerolineae bacterium]
MTDEQKSAGPRYHGMRKYLAPEAGYAIWMPSDWYPREMTQGHQGTLYAPNKDDYTTCFSIEKRLLEYGVRQKDAPILRKGFVDGLESLPGCEIESQDESITPTLIMFEARFTFLEGETRRKRWVRNVYWGKGQLIMIAQGATPEAFEYWLPMFFNTMTTVQIS